MKTPRTNWWKNFKDGSHEFIKDLWDLCGVICLGMAIAGGIIRFIEIFK